MNRGLLSAAGAYVMWGLLTMYWKALQHVPALEIMLNRLAWSLGVVVLLLAVRRRWAWLGPALRNPRVLLTHVVSGGLLALNWYIYIWAVNAGHIVEASLGYFINPLFSVILGILFLKERLRLGQGAAIGLALAGVVFLTYVLGALPWVGLALAFTFGIYGLLRKTSPLDSLQGLTLETLVLFPFALAYLVFKEVQGVGQLGHGDLVTVLMLVGGGIVTSTPLLLFAAGARQIKMTTLGLLQYITPTIQFLLGVTLYHEVLSQARLAGFAIIWLALVIYSAEGFIHERRLSGARRPAGQARQAVDH